MFNKNYQNNARIKYLETKIERHNYEYFVLNKPTINDNEFDDLVQELHKLNPESPILVQIGSDLNSEKKIAHIYPMLSLDKCYDFITFNKWFERIKGPIVSMLKIDGIACSIHYDIDGILKFAVTRGDGKEGEDITKNVLRIPDIPSKIINRQSLEIEIRGEIYLPISKFNILYQNSFSNPRNLAAGALKLKDKKKSTAISHLSFFTYNIYGIDFETELEKFNYLQQIGLKIVPVKFLKTAQEYELFYQTMKFQKNELNFEIDGIVFRANSIDDQTLLGLTAHHPRWSIAYKFQGNCFNTKLTNVQWSIGRTGTITPVAIFDPVFISGTKISKASLHNLSVFRNFKLKQNSVIEIARRGNVIPHVNKVLQTHGELYVYPNKCPSCLSSTIVEKEFLFCSNFKNCQGAAASRLVHFCTILRIDGIGKKIIYQLMRANFLKEPADLFKITKQQFCSMERVNEKLATKLMYQINNKRKILLVDFLVSLGLSEVGYAIAKIISDYFKTLENILNAKIDDFKQNFGIGNSISESIVRELKILELEIKNLLDQVQIEQIKKDTLSADHLFSNKTIVFTGSLEKLGRKEAQKRALQCGCKIATSVTKSTDYLIVGSVSDKYSLKHEKAKKMKIKIISEKEFLQILNIESI